MRKFVRFLIVVCGIAIIVVLIDKHFKGRAVAEMLSGVDKITGSFGTELAGVVKEADDEKVDEVFDFIKEKTDEGALSGAEGVKEVLKESEERFNIKIPEDTTQKISGAVENLENMGFSTEKKLYDKYGKDFTEHLEEAIVEAAKDAAGNTTENMIESAKESLSSLAEQYLQ